MKANKLATLLGGCVFALSTFQSLAHDIYIWPSYFTVDSDKPSQVSVDVTASHTPFRPDFAMPSNGVNVYGVDGKKIRRVGPYFEGKRRATFDLAIEEQGTYSLTYERGPSYFSRYTVGKRDTKKRLRAKKSVALAQMPKEGKNLETGKYFTIAMSYVTNQAPTNTVLQAKNTGFELVPVTHPADYVTGENIAMKLLFNGQPVEGLAVTIEKEAPQYQQQPQVFELNANHEGIVNVTFTQGGRYMLKVNHKKKSTDPEADYDITRVYYAFEVIYE